MMLYLWILREICDWSPIIGLAEVFKFTLE